MINRQVQRRGIPIGEALTATLQPVGGPGVDLVFDWDRTRVRIPIRGRAQ